jgi:hemolysin activation/secretion protein
LPLLPIAAALLAAVLLAGPATAATVTLRGVELRGTTVLDQAAVDALAAPLINQPLTPELVETLRRGLSEAYVARGHVTSGVVVPAQTVTDGVLVLQAVEGRVTAIRVTGAATHRPGVIERRIARGVTRPVQLAPLERAQRLMLQEPYVSRLDIDLQPGAEPGEATLLATVEERSRWGLTFEAANSQSPELGRVRAGAEARIGNLWGNGDALALRYGRIFADERGLNDYGIDYTLPLLPDGTRIVVGHDRTNRAPAAPQFRALGIRSEYDSILVGIARPFWRTPEQTFTLGLAIERRRARTFVLEAPFDFSAGSRNGRTNVTVLRFSQDWLDRTADRVVALRSTVSVGTAWLGATDPDTDLPGQARPQFVAWLGQAQYVRRVFDDAELIARATLQLSDDPLYPLEQLDIGGMNTVRGYRESLFRTDNGFVGSIELRIPVFRLPVPFLSRGPDDGLVQIAPFVDRGAGWNTRRPTPKPSDITGIGAGLRWLVGAGVLGELYLGAALRNVDAGTSLQDQGIHFRITAAVF